jgi:hypothetical protein
VLMTRGPILYTVSEATWEGLEDKIKTAMTEGTKITVPFVGAGGGGDVVLNGATLPFVVLQPPSR